MIADLYIKNDFIENFDFLKEEKLVLYGTGYYTKMLLEDLHEFNIVGLMDDAKTGENYYGLPVLSQEDIHKLNCKYIIIIANLSIAPVIYKRIYSFVQENRIKVFYMNGICAEKQSVDIDNKYIDMTWNKLVSKSMKYDVISFDMFDTLVMRKCLQPQYIFKVMDKRLKGMKISLPNFENNRMKAEKDLFHNVTEYFSLDDIYEELGKIYLLSKKEREMLKELELKTESEMLVPRVDMINVLKHLLKKGKKVIICSDMYLQKYRLEPLLKECGIPEVDIWVSVDEKVSKYRGSMFVEVIKSFPNKKILHIGDNNFSDVQQANTYGIESSYVLSVVETINFFKFKDMFSNIDEDTEILLKLFYQRAFRNALFSDHNYGKIVISSGVEMGYLFFAPLVIGYMSWLFQQIKINKIDHMLFVSRDGYIFYKIYQKFQKMLNLPKTSYFLTSRKCASIASIKNAEDIEFIIDYLCNRGNQTIQNVLENAFGIKADKDDDLRNVVIAKLSKSDVKRHIINTYKDKILKNAQRERNNYNIYIKKLKIDDKSRIGVMNFVGRGVTQKCLQKILGKKLFGFYFAVEYEIDEILKERYYSWYPNKMSTHTSKKNLYIQYLQGEAMFSAPYGQLKEFDENGVPIYEDTAEERIAVMNECHKGIMQYVNDIISFGVDLEKFNPNIDVIDKIFGLMEDDRFVFNSAINNGIVFEDSYERKEK